jgi:hypothetical protein
MSFMQALILASTTLILSRLYLEMFRQLVILSSSVLVLLLLFMLSPGYSVDFHILCSNPY